MPAAETIRVARFHPDVNKQWDLSGRENPLGQYQSFQEAYVTAFRKGEQGYNTGNTKVFMCIEEGIQEIDWRNIDIIRTAGNGTLRPNETLTILQQKNKQINAVVSHPECGAVALYAQENTIEGTVDEIADEQAKNFTQKAGIFYGGMITSIRRSFGLHPARAMYYDGTQQGFEASRISTLPQGFGVSRGFMGQDIGMKDAELAKNIALGHHGFGKKFTQETPFYLVALSDNNETLEQLIEELQSIRQDANNIIISSVNLSEV